MRGALLAGVLWLAVGTAVADEVRRGKVLFDQSWQAETGADPIGPLFNARACAECHPGGEAGRPDGPALVLRTPGDGPFGRQIQPFALPGVPPEPVPPRSWTSVRVAGGLLSAPHWQVDRHRLAGRLAPSLRGLGLLARIPQSTIARRADPEDRDGDGISGRLGPGRFGLKAEHATIEAAIEAALTFDLGLATEARPLPAGDCSAAQPRCLHAAGAGTPVAPRTLARLTTFVGALRPLPAATDVAGGASLLATIGCTACHAGPYHVPADPGVVGVPFEVIAPYTDLLLHDLGPALADPFPSADAAEWRTAPLWGLRRRAALLHDGRAATPREAILWHGGEAARSRAAFLALDQAAQTVLLDYLAGL